MDVEMKNECDYTMIPQKDSIDFEKMSISSEEDFKRIKDYNNSYNNIDNSDGDNYSTENSNIESDETKQKKNSIKESIQYSIKGYSNSKNEIQLNKQIKNKTSYEVQNVNEYIDDILENLIDEEKKCNSQINQRYFDYQAEISPKMRSILIDWIIDVHNKLNFKEETLYTTIYIMDTYLSKRFIQKNKFQLLGITSLFIASKLNEIYYRRIADYTLITDNAYSIEEIKYMEEEIANSLNFNFLVPTSLSFFEIISKKLGISEDSDIYKFVQFLIQAFLLDQRSLNFSYSTIACSCCYIAMKFYKIKNYQNCYNNKYYSIKNGYHNDKRNYIVIKCAKNVCSAIGDIFLSKLKAIIKKYNNYSFYIDITKFLDDNKK